MELDLIPTEDLLEAVSKRFDNMIFVGRKDTTVGHYNTKRRWNGDHHVCMGLAADISDEVMADLLTQEEPIKPEDS